MGQRESLGIPLDMCYGGGEIDDRAFVEASRHEVDCLCSECTGIWNEHLRRYVPSTRLIRCPDCGCVFNQITTWHESVTKSQSQEGQGTGYYRHKKHPFKSNF